MDDPEPGTTLEATTTELTELRDPEWGLFRIDHPTPREQPVGFVAVREDMARSMGLNTPPRKWTPVRTGKTFGVLSVYVSIDRNGRVREAWPLNSGNAQLEDAVRQQVQAWRFKPATNHGAPFQLEKVVTFAFDTKVASPVPVLSDAEARRLATHVVEPQIAAGAVPSGTVFRMHVPLDENGKLLRVGNPDNLNNQLFMAG